jgi:hypothetical protein
MERSDCAYDWRCFKLRAAVTVVVHDIALIEPFFFIIQQVTMNLPPRVRIYAGTADVFFGFLER